MSHIFISYSHKDAKYVEKLEKKLIEEGFNVWIDHRIDYGSRWTAAIENAIDTCDAYIVVMSEDAKKSEWVQREVIHAERRKKPFFPLLLSGEFWFSLGNIQFVDVRNGLFPAERFYERLATVISRNKKVGFSHPKPATTKQTKARQLAPTPKKKPTQVRNTLLYLFGGVVILACAIFGIGYVISNMVSSTPTPLAHQTANPEELATKEMIPEPEEESKEEPGLSESPPKDSVHGDTWVRPADNMHMSYIPAGEFQMGSEVGDDDEKPAHVVYLDAFWIDKTEITNSQFRIFVEQTGYLTDAEEKGSSWVYADPDWLEEDGTSWLHTQGPDTNINNYLDHPVLHVSWNDAQVYCEWANGRLPTEAEWEKAARGGLNGVAYPWGDVFDGSRLNFCDTNCLFGWADKNVDDGFARTSPVASFSPNGYGLFDMAGNVWELVIGPSSGESQVVRGGAWNSIISDVRVSNRSWNDPTNTGIDVGFRCARDVTP